MIEENELCYYCHGSGTMGFPNQLYPCRVCDATGRLKKTTEISYKPFSTEVEYLKDPANGDIELCSRCDGEGTIREKDLVDQHRREYEFNYYPCGSCNKTGRVFKVTSITHTPLKPKMTEIE